MNRGFQRSWWLALIALGVQQAVGTAIGLVCLLLQIDYLYLMMIGGTVALVVPILIGAIWVEQDGSAAIDAVPLKGFSARLIPYCILLPVMLQQLVVYAMLPLNAVFYILLGAAQESISAPRDAGTFILTFFALCVAAPVFEELLCRGVVMKLLEKYGFLVSVISSAALFAALHMELQSILPIFFLGLLFAVVRYATGSVLPSMLMHAANNFFALISMMLTRTQWAGSAGEVAVSILLAVLCPLAVWRFLKLLGGGWKINIQIKGSLRTGISAAMIILAVFVAIFNFTVMVDRFASGQIASDLHEMIGDIE